jgi:hypothetical protein
MIAAVAGDRERPSDNDLNPDELGLSRGHEWAEQAQRDESVSKRLHAYPRRIAESGDVPPAQRQYVLDHGVRDLLDEWSYPPGAEAQFWPASVQGVRAFVGELDAGNEPN